MAEFGDKAERGELVRVLKRRRGEMWHMPHSKGERIKDEG
jgi:hypothetical protein